MYSYIHTIIIINLMHKILPPDLLSVFDYQELDLLLCGVPEISVQDWKNNTIVRNIHSYYICMYVCMYVCMIIVMIIVVAR